MVRRLSACLLAAGLLLLPAACDTISSALGPEETPKQKLMAAADRAEVVLYVAETAVKDAALPAIARQVIEPAAVAIGAALDQYAAIAKTGTEPSPEILTVAFLSAGARLSGWLAANGLTTVAAGSTKTQIQWAAATLAAASEAGVVLVARREARKALVEAGLDPSDEAIAARLEEIRAHVEAIAGGG